MGECNVCGRVEDYAGCCRVIHGDEPPYDCGGECYRLGYERSQAALAAARRECDLLREELAKRGNISAPHSQMLPETP